ncbi:DUF6213 family protein [Streptomyces sp. P9(2023)]|uniref:DUF6213 family protein n=1 Tax=Streptomyces sp. P9(2023) TaxID=3064394 RepID=UPI0028F42D1C|nr:DUF6213 family protein [Streptomyces sp. P9(2023)]MDT9686993.1 DUF6213 family protein [Streptomyces sp. P9(2023)]
MVMALSLVSPDGAHLLVPADEVSQLLRHFADGWLRTADARGLDADTVGTLAGALSAVADQLDAECIAFMPSRDEEA